MAHSSSLHRFTVVKLFQIIKHILNIQLGTPVYDCNLCQRLNLLDVISCWTTDNASAANDNVLMIRNTCHNSSFTYAPSIGCIVAPLLQQTNCRFYLSYQTEKLVGVHIPLFIFLDFHVHVAKLILGFLRQFRCHFHWHFQNHNSGYLSLSSLCNKSKLALPCSYFALHLTFLMAKAQIIVSTAHFLLKLICHTVPQVSF